MTKLQVGMTLFFRCLGAVLLLLGGLAFLDCTISSLIFEANDPALVYIHARLMGAGAYVIFGILIITFARRMVILMSKGLKENES
jgi:hypothetical protein